MSKVLKTVVMRVTPDEAAKLRYQRKFDKAWANEQVELKANARVLAEQLTEEKLVKFLAGQGIHLLPPGFATVNIDGLGSTSCN